MSQQTRLASLISAIGADVKALSTTLKILTGATSLSDTEQPLSAVEWRYGGGSGQNLTGKLTTISPIVSAVVVNRSELWGRVKSRDGTSFADRMFFDSDGKSDFMPTVVSALPSTPYDGQEIFYLVNATGTVWHLKYQGQSLASFKWAFVGGSPIYAEVTTQESLTSTSYAALANAGPSIAVPLPGDYLVTQGATHNQNTASANSFMSYDIGGTGAVDADGIFWQNATALNAYVPGTRTRRKTLATALTLTSKYKVSAGSGTFRDRWMSVIPIRV